MNTYDMLLMGLCPSPVARGASTDHFLRGQATTLFFVGPLKLLLLGARTLLEAPGLTTRGTRSY